MNSTIFSTPFESFPVAHITYCGYISEIPQDKRKNNQTHSFKIMTSIGAVYCYYNGFEEAKKSHDSLEGMMKETKPAIFKYGTESIDASKIVSFSKVLSIKKPENGFTHAIVTTLETVAPEKSAQVWMHFKSDESAHNARKALYATILSLYKRGSESPMHDEEMATV
jgi:hypothetical protein